MASLLSLTALVLLFRHSDIDGVADDDGVHAWQRRIVFDAVRDRIGLAIFAEDTVMAGTVILAVSCIPLHDTAHMGAGGGHSDDLTSLLVVVAVAEDHIAHYRASVEE